MKHILLFLFFIYGFFIDAQTFTQEVNASGGGFYQQINGSMQFTIGEPITETYSNTTAKMTQGFEQGSYLILAVDELPAITTISIDLFPNPSNGFFNVFIKADVNSLYYIEVMDAQGKLILNKEINSGLQETIDMAAFSSSIYFVIISDAEKNNLKTFKIIKQ